MSICGFPMPIAKEPCARMANHKHRHLTARSLATRRQATYRSRARKPQTKLERVDPILGLVRLCRGCGEEWPVDDEFFFFQRGRVMGRCKACWSERVFIDGKRRWTTRTAA